MKLTRFTDNALRCLIYLAAAPTQTATVQEVSRAMRMSPDHLLKVIRRLTELGYLRTIRGRKGGVQLARSPASIAVADVVRATEENFAIVPCFDATAPVCPIAVSCVLAASLDESLRAFFAVLQRYTIADLVAGARWTLPLPAHTSQQGDSGIVPSDVTSRARALCTVTRTAAGKPQS